MAQRRNQSPVSLFSFQDVIMSVVGIVILITLILILKLITQMSCVALPSTVDVAEIQQEIESFRQTLRRIQDETVKLHQAKKNETAWIPLPEEADTLKQQVENLEKDIADVEKKVSEAEQHCEELKHSPTAQLLTEKQKTVQDLQEQLKELLKKNAELEDEETTLTVQRNDLNATLRELDKELAKDITASLKVKIPKQADKNAFIVLYGAGKIDLLPTDGSPERTFTSKSEFEQFVRTRDKNKEYFVMYIRPSRFDRYEEIMNDLKSLGFDTGLQVIGEKTDFSITN
jgi:septal ring factor EnvC (AmiA/AmiB activator)